MICCQSPMAEEGQIFEAKTAHQNITSLSRTSNLEIDALQIAC